MTYKDILDIAWTFAKAGIVVALSMFAFYFVLMSIAVAVG
jgi:hypothetical protein